MLRQSQRQRDREWERCRCHPLIQPRRRPTLHVLLLPAARVSKTLRPVSPKHLLDLERERAKKASRRAKCVALTAGRKSAVDRSVSANINFGTRIVLLGNTINVESNGMLQRRKARKKKRKGSSRLGTATKRPWEPLPLQWPQQRRVVGSTRRKRKTARRATRRTARRTASPGLHGLHGPVQRCTASVVAEKIRPQTVRAEKRSDPRLGGKMPGLWSSAYLRPEAGEELPARTRRKKFSCFFSASLSALCACVHMFFPAAPFTFAAVYFSVALCSRFRFFLPWHQSKLIFQF